MTVIGRFRHKHLVFTGEVIDNTVHSMIGGREYKMEEVMIMPPCMPTKKIGRAHV